MTLLDSFLFGFDLTFKAFFMLYTIAVIYALYRFIPRFGVALSSQIVTQLPQLLIQGISGLFQKEKMTALGQLGNTAKQMKAESLQLIADVDPVKAGIISWLEPQIPKMYRSMLIGLAEKSPVNVTGMTLNILSQKFPQLAESLKALGVVSNAQQVT